MIEQAFLSLLTTVPAVTTNVNDGVYFGMRPQNERRPSLVLTRTGTSCFRTLKHDGRFMDFTNAQEAVDDIITKSQSILKREWEVIKIGT